MVPLFQVRSLSLSMQTLLSSCSSWLSDHASVAHTEKSNSRRVRQVRLTRSQMLGASLTEAAILRFAIALMPCGCIAGCLPQSSLLRMLFCCCAEAMPSPAKAGHNRGLGNADDNCPDLLHLVRESGSSCCHFRIPFPEG